MRQPTEEPQRSIISLRLLTAVVAGSVAASFFLVPNQEELRERLFKDTIGGEILALIDSGKLGDKAAAHREFSHLAADQLVFISQLSQFTPKERLRRVFGNAREVKYDAFVHHFITAAVQYVDVVKPAVAFEIIAPNAEKIPEPYRLQLYRLLAHNALAINEPQTAVTILREAASGDADWGTIQNLVDAELWSNNPEQARAALNRWLKTQRGVGEEQLFAEAREMLYRLSLEANQPAEALAFCLSSLEEVPLDAAVPVDLLNKAFQAAAYAGKSKEVLPWIERHLRSFPEDQHSWQQLIAQHRRGEAVSAEYLAWTERASQAADWNSVAERACHHHLRLVAMGREASLDRYMPLAEYLGLGQQTAQMLKAVLPIAGRDNLQLTLARLTASNGDGLEAMTLYEKWLASHPTDKAARWEFACLKEVLARPGDAIETFKKLLRDYPEDSRAAQREVALLNRNGLHRESLKRMDQLPEVGFSADAVEDYLLLAESLDAPDSLARALRIKIAKSPVPLVADYMRLAEIARSAETMERAVSILREGIQRLPEEPMLRSQLAAVLLEEERFGEAVDEAMHPTAWKDLDARLTALAASIHCRRGFAVLNALGPEFKKQDLAYNTLLDLAVANQQVGRSNEAAELFARVPATPARCYRLAQAQLLARNFDEAARLAQMNLEGKTSPEAGDWILLGDIRNHQGLTEDAQVAYSNAVQAVTSRLRMRTAAAATASSMR